MFMNTKKALSLFALLLFVGVIFATQYKSSPSGNVKVESIEVEVNSFLSQVLVPKDKKDVLDYFGIDETNLVLVGEHNGCKFYTIKMDSMIFEEMLKPYKNKLSSATGKSILDAKVEP